MKKTTDIRVIRTQAQLLEALNELIKTKPLSCISITELCSKAGVNRNTFYYHYNNIYDLIEENKNDLVKELNETLDVKKTRSKTTVVNICKIIKRHPNLMSILISPNCELEYFNDIFGIASEKARIQEDKQKDCNDSRTHLICCYCNAGCNAVLCEWILNGMLETPEEIADIISDSSRLGPIKLLFPNG